MVENIPTFQTYVLKKAKYDSHLPSLDVDLNIGIVLLSIATTIVKIFCVG